MMIQQMLPPQKPLLLHIRHTSEKFWSGFTAHSKIFRGSILVQKGRVAKFKNLSIEFVGAIINRPRV